MAIILHAEDYGSLRRVMKMILGGEGHTLVQVCDGLGAIKSLEGSAPDLLLTDLNMPNASGYDVLDTVQRLGYDTRVIIHSSDEFNRRLTSYKGEVVILKKNGSPEVIRKTIRLALSR